MVIIICGFGSQIFQESNEISGDCWDLLKILCLFGQVVFGV
jgi:hypothetical protein